VLTLLALQYEKIIAYALWMANRRFLRMSVALGFNGVQWELYRRIVATFVEILKSHFKGIVRKIGK